LYLAINAIQPVITKYPDASCADIVVLSGVVAVAYMGGPKVPFRPGRTCKSSTTAATDYNRADLLLPPAIAGADTVDATPTSASFPTTISAVRGIFSRMGFTDQETVALIGAHTVGKCHANFSGFEGKWTSGQFTFSNAFFIQLKTFANGVYSVGTLNDSNGIQSKTEYVISGTTLMMLPADVALLYDPSWMIYVDQYAANKALYLADFAQAFAKLTELGVEDVVTSDVYVYGANAVNYTTSTKAALSSSISFIALALAAIVMLLIA
jgi:cytochrome c peroxidase